MLQELVIAATLLNVGLSWRSGGNGYIRGGRFSRDYSYSSSVGSEEISRKKYHHRRYGRGGSFSPLKLSEYCGRRDIRCDSKYEIGMNLCPSDDSFSCECYLKEEVSSIKTINKFGCNSESICGALDGSCNGIFGNCTSNSDCCDDLLCDTEYGVCNTYSEDCYSADNRCNEDSECCDEWECRDGICKAPVPTVSPTKSPSNNPSNTPTKSPSKNPSKSPSKNPSKSPSNKPTVSPTESDTSDITYCLEDYHCSGSDTICNSCHFCITTPSPTPAPTGSGSTPSGGGFGGLRRRRMQESNPECTPAPTPAPTNGTPSGGGFGGLRRRRRNLLSNTCESGKECCDEKCLPVCSDDSDCTFSPLLNKCGSNGFCGAKSCSDGCDSNQFCNDDQLCVLCSQLSEGCSNDDSCCGTNVCNQGLCVSP